MRSPSPFVLLASILYAAIALTAPPAHSQTPPGSVTIIRPTDNGYDDLLAAIAALRDEPAATDGPPPPGANPAPTKLSALDKAQQTGATLADKRAAVRDPKLQTAIALLHTAFTKPRIEPPSPKSLFDPQFEDSAGLRNLSRLLGIVEYVQLADGNTGAAIDTFADQLALSDVMQRWTLLSLLSGQAIIAIGSKPIEQHIDRLSAGDCSHLLDMLRSELNTTNPAIEGFQNEAKQSVAGVIALLTAPPETPGSSEPRESEYPEPTSPDEPTFAEAKELYELQKAGGPEWKQFVRDVVARVQAQNDLVLSHQFGAPPPVTLPKPEGRFSRFVTLYTRFTTLEDSTVGKALDRTLESRARLQLLALRAALARYRWEHNTLPKDLADLKVGPLTTDPYVGGSIGYTLAPDGKSYVLTIAGPLQRDDSGMVIPGSKRKPITAP